MAGPGAAPSHHTAARKAKKARSAQDLPDAYRVELGTQAELLEEYLDGTLADLVDEQGHKCRNGKSLVGRAANTQTLGSTFQPRERSQLYQRVHLDISGRVGQPEKQG
jgi:hypothetical protein